MTTLSIKLLFKRQFKENFKFYGIGLLVLFAMLLLMFLVVHQWRDSFAGAVQNGVFVIGLFVAGGLFTSSMFHEFSNPQSGMWMLSIPATHAEKVLTSLLWSVVVFLVTYFIVFYLADVIYLLSTEQLSYLTILNPFKDGFYQFIFYYLIFNGVVLFGSIVFNKYSFIKTILMGIILLVFFNYLNAIILHSYLPEVTIISNTAFDSFIFSHEGENVSVALLDGQSFMSSVFVRGLLPMSIWVLVWLKLKEKQI